MNFLVDMPLSPALASWLRDNNHDAIHASEAGLSEATDEELISIARAQNRLIVTADLDFPRLLAQSNARKPGLIVFRGGDYNQEQAESWMSRVLNSATESELQHSIVIVEHSRIRKRLLPL